MHSLKYSNKEAQKLIDSHKITIDGLIIESNCLLSDTSEIKVDGKLVRKKIEWQYLKFYKPRGFQSSLNEAVENNLFNFFKNYPNLAIAGRLDKDSEGLLLLSNDGKWVEQICHPEFEKEKEYEVCLNKPATEALCKAFIHGMRIGNFLTKPAICEKINTNTLRIILKEGKNRQIRRMCYKMGFEVLFLKRLRIDVYKLGHLKSGEMSGFQLNKSI